MNPFSLSFGKEPVNVISREKQINEIIEGFASENPEFQTCMITGVRGSGKTVFMTEVAERIGLLKNWIVIELSPERDMLHSLAAELSNRKELLQIFRDAKLNLSFLGFGLEIDSEPPITDVVVAIDRMLEHLSKRKKNIFIALDEAVSNQYVRGFLSQFQIFIRKKYNVFLLMTGLYDKIYELQNEETLTFLYRAPKFELEPLNQRLIAQKYQQIFNIEELAAYQMARLVRGYSYAYQVLGYLCFKRQEAYNKVLDEFDAYLGEYVYDKIWFELSGQDKNVLKALANVENGKVEDIRNAINMSPSKFSVYRDRLIKKGIVRSETYGFLEFTLPRFDQYVKLRCLFN